LIKHDKPEEDNAVFDTDKKIFITLIFCRL